MHYFGGKYRIADKIADFINPLFKPNQYYVEPFVGGASILTKITNPLRIASDANETLITMWKALANGWTPPNFVSENEYAEIKEKNDKNDPLTAFVGFGCSYSGKWFGGYARDDTTRNYAMNAANSLYKKNKCLVNVEWQCGDYKNIVYPNNSIIYCDPPYANTTQYNGVSEKFNTEDFWNFCRQKTKEGHIVLISEYNAPEDFACLFSIETKLDIHTKNNSKRTEKIFSLNVELSRKIGGHDFFS